MTNMQPEIAELLALRATEGLTGEQASRLRELLETHGVSDTEALDLAAAAAANAYGIKHARTLEEAPERLKGKLLDDAEEFFGRSSTNVVDLPQKPEERSRWNWGWAAAAALALLLIATNFEDLRQTEPNYTEARLRLVASGEDTRVIEWDRSEYAEFASVRGDVVWNDERQEGYLLLTGMPANDPQQSQYQLWLVDRERDSNPVDGGVFDIPAGPETVVVPIDAKLEVDAPTIFAVTREKPGGVVVSNGPMLLVASAG